MLDPTTPKFNQVLMNEVSEMPEVKRGDGGFPVEEAVLKVLEGVGGRHTEAVVTC